MLENERRVRRDFLVYADNQQQVERLRERLETAIHGQMPRKQRRRRRFFAARQLSTFFQHIGRKERRLTLIASAFCSIRSAGSRRRSIAGRRLCSRFSTNFNFHTTFEKQVKVARALANIFSLYVFRTRWSRGRDRASART